MVSGVEQVREYAKKVLPTVGESVVFAIGGSLSCGFAYECSDVDIYAIAPDSTTAMIKSETSPHLASTFVYSAGKRTSSLNENGRVLHQCSQDDGGKTLRTVALDARHRRA